MRTKLVTIIVLIFMLSFSSIPASAITPKQYYKNLKASAQKNSDKNYKQSVSYKKNGIKYEYLYNVKFRQVNSTDFEIANILIKSTLNARYRQLKNFSKDCYRNIKKYHIKGDFYLFVKASDNKIIWKFKNGKLIYNYLK